MWKLHIYVIIITTSRGDGEVEGVVGKHGVPNENESSERLLDMCMEQELVKEIVFSRRKG